MCEGWWCGKPIEEKSKDEDKGKGKAEGTGNENAQERAEGKGKAQISMKGEEEKPNERGKEDLGDERKPDLWSIFKLHPLCPGLPLPHNRTRCLDLNRT